MEEPITEVPALKFYQKYYLRSLILEVFDKSKGNDIIEKSVEIHKNISKVSEQFGLPTHVKLVIAIRYELEFFQNVKFIKKTEDGLKLTDEGVSVLQQGHWENLANTALLGYRSLEVSKEGNSISREANRWAKWAVVISFLAVLVTLCVSSIQNKNGETSHNTVKVEAHTIIIQHHK